MKSKICGLLLRALLVGGLGLHLLPVVPLMMTQQQQQVDSTMTTLRLRFHL